MAAIFLEHVDAAGARTREQLSLEDDGGSIFFLPDSPSNGRISPSHQQGTEHSYLCVGKKTMLNLLAHV